MSGGNPITQEREKEIRAWCRDRRDYRAKRAADLLSALDLAREERDRLLADLYALGGRYSITVARLCDEKWDPSGALLGRVRALAAGEGTAE